MNQILTIWMQPIYARLNMESKKSLVFLLISFPVAGQVIAGLLFFSRPDRFEVKYFLLAFMISVAALLAVIFFAWLIVLIHNIILQYSPANARLLPRFSRILKLALCIPIVLVALLASGFMFIVTHQFSFFPAFVTVFVLSFMVLVIRSPWAIIPFILCFQIPMVLERLGLKRADKIFSENLGLSFEGALFFFAALMLWAILHWTFALRGEALFSVQQRSQMLRDAVSGKKLSENDISIGLATPFLVWMRTCIQRQLSMKEGCGNRAKLLAFAFGPRLHWSTTLLQIVLITFFCSIALVLASFFFSGDGQELLLVMSVSMGGVSLVILPLNFCAQLFSTLLQTRVEQSLVSLAPNAGGNQCRDRVLANYLLRQFGILYTCGALPAFVLGIWLHDNDKAVAGIVLLLSCFYPMIMLLTRQYAHISAITDHVLAKLIAVCAVLFVMGVVMIFYASLQSTYLFSTLILVLTSALFMYCRHRQLSNAMFPVGRCA